MKLQQKLIKDVIDLARLFGTDGVRGVANEDITPELALNIGRATACVLSQGRRRRALVVIGKDTRVSSDMLESALVAGLCSIGADVISLGVVPTPAVAYLLRQYKADAGIMISASHNPYPYNGIKIFNGDGFKLVDELENQIEELVLDTPQKMPLAHGEEIGTLTIASNACRDYIEYLKSTIPNNLSGMKIAVDCANGSASETASILFKELGAEAIILSNEANGININENCGSTHMKNLQEFVVAEKLQAGIAFDGDADRCLCVDECGNIVDGDFIMAICSLDMKNRGKLRHDTVVGTIMANMGFSKFCEENGINLVSTKVGDRYVLEEMEMENYRFGGEQSGHVIFRDFSTTGDGQLTAIQLLNYMHSIKKPLSELTSVMKKYPQVLHNVAVSAEGRLGFYNNEAIKECTEKYKQKLGDNGRVLIRVSGTEPLIRVMVEGTSETIITDAAKELVDVIKKELS